MSRSTVARWSYIRRWLESRLGGVPAWSSAAAPPEPHSPQSPERPVLSLTAADKIATAKPVPTDGEAGYALLTAAYNEEQYIEETLRSVVAQVLPPRTWVIVSDGSTDRTDAIVQQYAITYPFIQFVRRERDRHRRFASKVFALQAGWRTLTLGASQHNSTQFIGHLDADVALTPFYFRDLLQKFANDASLGLAGGWCFEESGQGRRDFQPSSANSVPGAVQMFRRKCYEDIGGLLPIEYGGEDWYAEIRARQCGWRVCCFADLPVRHLRARGAKGNRLTYSYQEGFADFALGSHPVVELARVVRRILARPCLLGSLARLSGFLLAHLLGRRLVSPDFVAWVRKDEFSRLWSILRRTGNGPAGAGLPR